MKIEWLVTNVTPVGSPDRVERAILWVIWAGYFLPIQAIFVVGEAFCDVRNPSGAPISSLRVIS